MIELARRVLVALATVTLLPAAALADTIEWTASAAAEPPGWVRLRVERSGPGSRNSDEHDVPATALAGLDLSRDGKQRFALRREAGSLDCAGMVRAGHGVGDCRFTPDERFADALARAGMVRPDDRQSFTLAMVDAHAVTAAALSRFGARPSFGDFIALSIHGASPEWIDGLASAGQRNVKAGDLIAYRIHGVTGAWLRGLIAAAPALASADSGEIIAMRLHGVSPEWVRGIVDAGYRNVPPHDLIAMRIHGVTPEFARAAASMRPRPDAGDLIARRIHGGM